jgi:hydrogenase maturation protease
VGTLPSAVELDRREGEPTAVLAAFEGADMVWLVDAVCSGVRPGTVHRLDATVQELPSEVFRTSTHHVGLAEAVELARALGRLPRSTVVYGIEGASFAVGDGLSPDVAAVIDSVAAAIREEVAACTSEP